MGSWKAVNRDRGVQRDAFPAVRAGCHTRPEGSPRRLGTDASVGAGPGFATARDHRRAGSSAWKSWKRGWGRTRRIRAGHPRRTHPNKGQSERNRKARESLVPRRATRDASRVCLSRPRPSRCRPGHVNADRQDFAGLRAFHTHQHIELPEIQMNITHFILQQGECAVCGATSKGFGASRFRDRLWTTAYRLHRGAQRLAAQLSKGREGFLSVGARHPHQRWRRTALRGSGFSSDPSPYEERRSRR